MKAPTYIDEIEASGKYDVAIFEYSRLQPGVDEVNHPPTSLQIFEVQEGRSKIDLVKLVGSVGNLAHFFSWTNVASELDGCDKLVDPVCVRPEVPLKSPKCPTLCLLQALREKGSL